MSTRQQRRDARRVNAQKPALQSGLDESNEDLAQLGAEYYQHFQPRNPEERFQVDSLIRNDWFLRRFFQVEDQLWECSGPSLGEAFSKASSIFMRLQRRITLAEKAYKEAKAELERLKALPQPEETTVETQQLGSFLTSVGQALPSANRPQPDHPLDKPLHAPLD